MPKPRIILWDLETTNLSANYGYMLCASWKVYGDPKTHLIKISDSPTWKKDPTNDKYVAQKLRDVLITADGWVTHYGSRFDEPYLNSRLLMHNLSPLPPMGKSHIDTWRIAKYKLKMNSNRLASVAAFLGLEEKTPLNGPIWIKAMAGHKPSLQYVYEHCIQDVKVLEQVYDKIRVLCNDHFNVNLVTQKTNGCPRCGSERLQSRGYSYAYSRKYPRYQCQSCGAWSRGLAIRLAKKVLL